MNVSWKGIEMYSLKEIEEKIKLAKAAKLSGAELLDDTELAIRVCNGIGAAWMPNWMRNVISGMNPSLVLAADIHDIRYELGGTEADRKAADDEMLENGYKLAAYRYGWYDPRRYLVRRQMKKFHMILREFGGWAFNKSGER